MDADGEFQVYVSKDFMKFNAAHFVAYKGFREKLHGHNYQLSVCLSGKVSNDGYVLDFGIIKSIARNLCRELNETFLVPLKSDVLKIAFEEEQVNITAEDNSKFSFPRSDCSLLPLVHSTAEELAAYICDRIIQEFGINSLKERGISHIEISVAEATNQLARFKKRVL